MFIWRKTMIFLSLFFIIDKYFYYYCLLLYIYMCVCVLKKNKKKMIINKKQKINKQIANTHKPITKAKKVQW